MTLISALCHAFELDAHFQCYGFERNPSITVQCNVLSALLEVFDKSEEGASLVLRQSIYKVVVFISETFWTSRDLDDKWVYSLVLCQIRQFADDDLAYLGVICFPSDSPEFDKIHAPFR